MSAAKRRFCRAIGGYRFLKPADPNSPKSVLTWLTGQATMGRRMKLPESMMLPGGGRGMVEDRQIKSPSVSDSRN